MNELPAGWIECPVCDGYGEWVEGSIRGPIKGPVTCWRCKGQGAVRG